MKSSLPKTNKAFPGLTIAYSKQQRLLASPNAGASNALPKRIPTLNNAKPDLPGYQMPEPQKGYLKGTDNDLL